MKIEIKHIDKLDKEELISVQRLEEKAFGIDNGEDSIQWIEKAEWHILIWEKNILAAHIEVTERTVTVSSKEIKVGCVGGVCSDPTMRGKGLASKAVLETHELIKNKLGLDYAILLTGEDEAPFYDKFGYSIINEPCVMEQKSGKVIYEDVVMALPLNDSSWPKGAIDLCGYPW